MTKKQFWEIIETINRNVPDNTQAAMLKCAEEELNKLTLQDLVRYQAIFYEYLNAACREYLRAASAALGAHYTDDGFIDFRSWLISRGKKIYMAALRNPETLVDGPIREGERLNFEQFAYVPSKVYAEKFKKEKEQPGGFNEYDDLHKALSAYPLNRKEKRTIRADIPKRKDIDAEWSASDLACLFPRICSDSGNNSQTVGRNAARILWTMAGAERLVRGHVGDDTGITVYLFENTPLNIACFIGSRPMAEWIIITDLLDREILSTYGWFIDRCIDQGLLKEVMSVLVPIQLGEAEPKPLLSVTEDVLDEYLSQNQSEDDVL